MTIVVSGFNKTFRPAKLIESSYLARPKTRDERILTGRVTTLSLFVSANSREL